MAAVHQLATAHSLQPAPLYEVWHYQKKYRLSAVPQSTQCKKARYNICRVNGTKPRPVSREKAHPRAQHVTEHESSRPTCPPNTALASSASPAAINKAQGTGKQQAVA